VSVTNFIKKCFTNSNTKYKNVPRVIAFWQFFYEEIEKYYLLLLHFTFVVYTSYFLSFYTFFVKSLWNRLIAKMINICLAFFLRYRLCRFIDAMHLKNNFRHCSFEFSCFLWTFFLFHIKGDNDRFDGNKNLWCVRGLYSSLWFFYMKACQNIFNFILEEGTFGNVYGNLWVFI
jgi:hypothetical protein